MPDEEERLEKSQKLINEAKSIAEDLREKTPDPAPAEPPRDQGSPSS